MKIVFAPDSFKNSIRSPEVCNIMLEAFRSELPDCQYVCIPMADGGEGTVEAALAAGNGEKQSVEVKDPLGRKIIADFAYFPNEKKAIMEMAAASGLELLKKEEQNPLLTNTYGTGQLLLAAQKLGAKEIIMGIGGSATVDAGTGMLQALGCRLLDKNGNELSAGAASLKKMHNIDCSAMKFCSKNCKIVVASDVKSPLCGPNGASYLFAKQKGATEKMLPELDKALKNFGELLIRKQKISDYNQEGDGAAGGLGIALRAFLNAEVKSGAELLADFLGLEKVLEDADLLITGEGSSDEQTLQGKLPFVVAQIAKKHKVPTILLSGGIKGDKQVLRKHFNAVFSTLYELNDLETTLKNAKKDLYDRAKDIAAIIKLN